MMRYRVLMISCIIILLPALAWASLQDMEDYYREMIRRDYETREFYEQNELSISLDSSNVELVGRLPFGSALDVYTVGNYAYLCAGGTLVILDVSSPSTPAEIGRIDTPGIAEGVHVVGNYAYVADYQSLRVMDISDPAKPREVGVLAGCAYGVQVVGVYAYVAGYELRVVDISDPANLQEVGTCDYGWGYGIHVVGSYAYLADQGGSAVGLRIMDVSDPTNPHQVGFCSTPDPADGVFVAGNYAYVGDRFEGLRVIDVSDPTDPHEVGACDTPWWAHEVYVVGSYAYVATGSGVSVIEVSDPTSPYEVSFYTTPGWAVAIHIVGDYGYVADWEGLRVIDTSAPPDVKEVGDYDTPGLADDIHVVGDYAYMARWSSFQVVDISDPSNPRERGIYYTPGHVYGVHVVGDYAYLASQGLLVMDVSDPANPRQVGFCDTPGSARGLHVAGDRAYVADGSEGLRVIDISDPTEPHEVGFCDTAGTAFEVYVVGSYAYVVDSREGLCVIDISDPTKPCEVGFCDTPQDAEDVYVVGNYAYVAGRDLYVIDISVPTNPYEVGRYSSTLTGARDVHVVGDYAYVAFSDLRVIDVSDPTNPREVGFYGTSSLAYGVYVAGDHIYVADGHCGLCILRCTGDVPGQPDISLSASHHNFGEVLVGSNADWKVSISNVGSTDLTVSSVTTGNPVFTIASPTFPQNVPPDGVLDVTVRFSPSSEVSYSSALLIASNDPDESFVIVSLLGQGVAPESLSGELAEAMEGHGYSVEKDDSGVINQGGTSNPYNFSNTKTRDLAFGLNWPGSVLRLSVYEPNGVLYAQEQSDEPPLIIQVDQAEPGEWGYIVTGVDVPHDGYPYVVQVGVPDGIKVDLAAGWNLISLPLQPLDTSPEMVLFSINGICNSVWAYDPDTGWSVYVPGRPGDLEKMEAGRGYWIEMDESGTLMAQGIAPESTAIVLKGGAWNLTGYCALNSKELEDCNLPDCVHSVWEYSADPQNTGWTVYAPGGSSDLVSMKPGFGYWIKVRADHPDDCVWDVNQHLNERLPTRDEVDEYPRDDTEKGDMTMKFGVRNAEFILVP